MTGSELLAKPSGLCGETEHLLFHGGHIQMCVAHLSKHALIRRQRQGSFLTNVLHIGSTTAEEFEVVIGMFQLNSIFFLF